MRRIHIEKKRRGDPQSLKRLQEMVLKDASARWSPRKIAARTALPLDEASWAMMALASVWPSRLYALDDGTLEATYTPIDEPGGWGDWLRRHESAWRKLGSMVTTVLIAPMALMVSIHWMSLVVSLPSSFLQIVVALIICLPVGVTFCFSMLALVFEALLFAGLAMLLAAVAFPVGIVWTGAWDEWWVIPLSLVLFGGVGAMVTQMGWTMLSSFLMESGELESTWRGIAEILIGPRSQGVEALEDEGRILAWIQERRGIVTVWELAALLGATPDEASRDITHLLVDYGGDILVTDEGAIVFTFDWLRAPDALPESTDAPTSWLNLTDPPRLLRAHHAWGLLICLSGAVMGVILSPDIAAWPSLADVQHAMSVTGDGEEAIPPYGFFSQWFGLWPYAALLAIIVARAPIVAWKRARYQTRMRIATLAQAIVASQGELTEPPSAHPNSLLAAFDADVDLEHQVVGFPKARLELAEALRMRGAPVEA